MFDSVVRTQPPEADEYSLKSSVYSLKDVIHGEFD